jgi:hypothetical protein
MVEGRELKRLTRTVGPWGNGAARDFVRARGNLMAVDGIGLDLDNSLGVLALAQEETYSMSLSVVGQDGYEGQLSSVFFHRVLPFACQPADIIHRAVLFVNSEFWKGY